MKILFATYPLAFQNPGGGEQVILALRRELIGQGHEVDLFDPWLHEVGGYDVIHYFSCIDISFWRYAKSWAPATPLFVTPTLGLQNDLRSRFWLLKQRALVALERVMAVEDSSVLASFRLPDFWLPTTAREGAALCRLWQVPAGRVRILPNGVEEGFARGDQGLFRERMRIHGPFVLHVGRFDPVKNQPILIESLKRLKLHGVFIGSADIGQEAYYQSCVDDAREAEASDTTRRTRFTFLSAMPHDDPLLASAYAAADVFALPSRFETFGISALEAAVAGAPLVLTRNVFSREVFEPISSLVDPDDPEEIALAILACLGRRGSSGRAAVAAALLERYGWPRIAGDLLEIYRAARA